MGEAEIEALSEGGRDVFADLSSWWKFQVGGGDAVTWLNDLITARIDDLRPHESRRSLLLSRTGHVMAEFHVMGTDQGPLLVQDPTQPRPVQELLEPYVLSSDVSLQDRTGELALLSFPTSGGKVVMFDAWMPSVLGSGVDQLFPSENLDGWKARNGHRVGAGEEDLEVWRIRRGIPRFGVDLSEDGLPAEAGWDGLIDRTKGCFLGQEAVAKVRNLGHPPRLIVPLHSARPVKAGQTILAATREVGTVTSAAPDGEGSALLGRVRWEARDAELRTASGHPLARRAA